MAIQLISTDFDGTIFAEFENPPIPPRLQTLLGALQARGGWWVINTGRDMASLMETLGRAHPSVHPDALVLVEREIYVRQEGRYVPLPGWNEACTRDHGQLFREIRPALPGLYAELSQLHAASFYEDAFSPLCVIAESNAVADAVQERLEAFARSVPHLSVVRNDVYIRLAHDAYDKGSALAELGLRFGVGPEQILAAGDHYNDLPMLDPRRARWLVAPANAIPEVQTKVKAANGFLSAERAGLGVAEGIEHFLATTA